MYHTKVAKKNSHLKKKVHVIKFCNYAVEKREKSLGRVRKRKGPRALVKLNLVVKRGGRGVQWGVHLWCRTRFFFGVVLLSLIMYVDL